MKKLLVLFLFILFFNCKVRFDENKTIYIVDTIDTSYHAGYKLHLLLRRVPFDANYKNEINFFSNDYTIKVGDKFKLIKIEE